MGLIKEENKFAVLTDILGDEDHTGDMDFKVTGTAEGITALQMDIKIHELSRDIMERALDQARAGRLHILDKMLQALAVPREEISPFAPKIISIKINPDKIRDIIGPGGKTIKAIQEQTGANIDVNDAGVVSTPEPFGRLFNQGMIRSFAYRDGRGMPIGYDDVEFRNDGPYHRKTGERLAESVEKMAKSLKNVVSPANASRFHTGVSSAPPGSSAETSRSPATAPSSPASSWRWWESLPTASASSRCRRYAPTSPATGG